MANKQHTVSLYISIAILVVAVIILIANSSEPQGRFSDPALIINGDEISLEEVRTIYATYDAPTRSEAVLGQVIRDIIDYRIVLQDARNQGIEVSNEEVENAFNAFLARQRITEDEFSTQLNGTGATVDDYRLRIREDLLVNKALSKLDTNVSSVEVTNYYSENIEQFLIPEEVVVRQITLPLNITEQQLQATTTAIFSDLRQEEFCAVAQRYSLDKTCNSYSITQEDAFPAYVTAAFNQDAGTITLVEGPDGYYFVQTLNKRNLNALPLNQVRDNIRAQLGDLKFQQAYAQYIDTLRSEASIENLLER